MKRVLLAIACVALLGGMACTKKESPPASTDELTVPQGATGGDAVPPPEGEAPPDQH